MDTRLKACLIFLITACGLSARDAVADSVCVHFRQSKVNVDTTYMANNEAFRQISRIVDLYHQPDSGLVLLNVSIVGGASPEGSVSFNSWLSKQRAQRIYDYMESRMLLPDSLTEVKLLGRDWEGLLRLVAADPNVPCRNEVTETLNLIIAKYERGERQSDHNLQRLKQVAGGRPYRYLYRNLFPKLRESSIRLTFGRPALHNPYVEINLPPELLPQPAAIAIPEPLPVALPQKKPFYMALKSNLICDVLSLPEIGAEFYLGRNWSAVANWMYGWWDRDRTHRYWRAYGGDLAVRRWFGHAASLKPLTGHHLGLYGGVVTYDFEFGGKGYMGGRPGHNLWDRCMGYGGVEYGYALPIARRLNFDFTVGLGYMGGREIEYEPKGRCYDWEKTRRKNWIGPTKLEVSLVWLIGRGNYNIR